MKKHPFAIFFNQDPDHFGGGNQDNGNNNQADNTETDQDGDDQSGNSGNHFNDTSLYRSYHGLDESGKRPKGALAQAFEKLESEESDESDSGKSEEKGDDQNQEKDGGKNEGEKKNIKEKEKELSVDDLLKIEPKNKDGSPLSAGPSVLIKNLKSHLTRANERLKEYDSPEFKERIQRYETIESQLTEALDKNKQLQERFEEEFFESSDAFKEAIEKPVQDAFEEVSEFFSHYDDKDPDEAKAIREAASIMKEATKLAVAGKNREYLKKVEELSGFIEGEKGGIMHMEFSRAMAKYKDAAIAQHRAYQDKGENRRKLVEARVSESRSKKIGSVENDLSSFLKGFEANNKVFMEHLPSDLKEKYTGSYKNNEKVVKGALSKFAVTGAIPEELNSIISKGVAYDSLEQEKVLAWGAFKDAQNKIKILESQLTEEKKKNEKYTGKGNTQSRTNPGFSSSSNTGKRSALADSLKTVGALQD